MHTGVHEVPYNNPWKIFVVREGTAMGRVKPEAVSRMPRQRELEEERGNARSECLFILFPEFIT